VFRTAPFVTATFADVAVAGLEGTSRLELPGQADLLSAADSVIEPTDQKAGGNLPVFVSRSGDGSVRLRLRVAIKSISEEGAMGWTESHSEPWPSCFPPPTKP